MRIIDNALDNSVYEICLHTVDYLRPQGVWWSSFQWPDNLLRGVVGPVLITPVPEHLSTILYDGLKEKEPLFATIPYDDIRFLFQWWHKNSSVSTHNDRPYKFAATIFLNRDWCVDYGGLLVYQYQENDWRAVVPKKNTMTINDGLVTHAVTPTAFNAPEDRLTIQIFALSEEDKKRSNR